jgi:anti-anti-sigma regulatory factor
MDFKFNEAEDGSCVALAGSMICKNSRAIEQSILDFVRQHRHLKIDLSAVNEIDRCGIHLLAMIKSFGVEFVEIVATSPIVDAAMANIPATRRKALSVKARPMPHPVSNQPKLSALSI